MGKKGVGRLRLVEEMLGLLLEGVWEIRVCMYPVGVQAVGGKLVLQRAYSLESRKSTLPAFLQGIWEERPTMRRWKPGLPHDGQSFGIDTVVEMRKLQDETIDKLLIGGRVRVWGEDLRMKRVQAHTLEGMEAVRPKCRELIM